MMRMQSAGPSHRHPAKGVTLVHVADRIWSNDLQTSTGVDLRTRKTMRDTKESIECAGVDGPLRWIKFEHYVRYHAIYSSHWGVYWTYCGRSIRPQGVRDEKTEPPARCGCCRSRVKRPYLIPTKIAGLKVEV